MTYEEAVREIFYSKTGFELTEEYEGSRELDAAREEADARSAA